MKNLKTIFINGLSARLGGPETFLYNVLKSLSAYKGRWRLVLVVSTSNGDKFRSYVDEIVCIPELVFNNFFFRLICDQLFIPLLFFLKNGNVYFQSDEMLPIFIGISPIRSIVVFHATQHLVIPETLHDSFVRMKYVQFVKKSAYHLASRVLTVSKNAKNELVNGYQKKRDVGVIYHGVDSGLRTRGLTTRSTLEIQTPYLLSVSNRHGYKNYLNLVKAFHLASKSFDTPASLVLIGQPKDDKVERDLKSYITKHKLEEVVKIYNYIDHNDLPAVYVNALAYVFPSTFETFGMTPLEAMASGLPTVCSNVSCIPEICSNASLYFNPLDVEDMTSKVRMIVNDQTTREQCIKKGFERSTKFSWEDAAKKYYDELEDLLK